jgi:curved DNA-binding protein CbpA
VAEKTTFVAWAESLDALSYYDILRVDVRASPRDVQKAFHALSVRCHPDRFVEDGREVAAAASVVFKRVVEAYTVLRSPKLRGRYDAELARGVLRLDDRVSSPPPRYDQRTLAMIAKTEKARRYAVRADALIQVGKLDEARVQLINATQEEPDNVELKERLQVLYEALLLESIDF